MTSRTFTGLTIDATSSQPFSASLERIRLGSLSLAEATADPSNVTHTREHILKETGDPYFLLHLQLVGKSINSQAGRDADLQVGDFALCDTTRPYRLAFREPATFLVVRLPAGELRSRFASIDDAVGVRVSGASRRTALLASFLQSVREQARQPSEDDDWDGLVSICAEFVAMCAQATPARHASAIQNRTERRVLQSVHANLRTPDFGVQDIAKEVSVSTRSVQKVFAVKGTTASAYILQRRLSEAAKALELTDMLVTEIAMELGFNDLTYFARRFRGTYGETPRDYRRKVRR